MGLNEQIFWGSLFLGWCTVLHIGILGAATPWLAKYGYATLHWKSDSFRNALLILITVLFLVLSHTLQIWGYAAYFIHHDTLDGWNEAIYFSLVTYTSLGYGDITLGPDYRIFGAFASVTGLLAFGLSTAFLVAVMGQMLRSVIPGITPPQSKGANNRASGAP